MLYFVVKTEQFTLTLSVNEIDVQMVDWRFEMGHVGKYTQSSCGKLMAHYERKKKDGKYVKFGNIDIDTSRTHLNYNLAPTRPSQYKFMEKRLDEIFVYGRGGKRTDIKTMADWVITKPKDFPEERSREFFEKTYKFMTERYGEDNVISAYVHVDETSPHMHFSFVPVVLDKKKNRYKLSAKDKLNVYDLRTFHKDLEKSLTKHFKFDVGILNGATVGGNKSIAELKLATAMKDLEKANLTIKQQTKDLDKYSVFRDNIDDVDSIEFKKHKLINKKSGTIDIADFERVKDIAKVVPMLQVENKDLTKDLTTSKQETKDMKDRWYKSYNQIDPLNAEIDDLRAEVGNLREYIGFFGVEPNISVFRDFKHTFETAKEWNDLEWHLTRETLVEPLSEENITNHIDSLVKTLVKNGKVENASKFDLEVVKRFGKADLIAKLKSSSKFKFNENSKVFEVNHEPKVKQKQRKAPQKGISR